MCAHVFHIHAVFYDVTENSVNLARMWATRPRNWVRLPAEAEYFFFPRTVSRPAVGPTQPHSGVPRLEGFDR